MIQTSGSMNHPDVDTWYTLEYFEVFRKDELMRDRENDMKNHGWYVLPFSWIVVVSHDV